MTDLNTALYFSDDIDTLHGFGVNPPNSTTNYIWHYQSGTYSERELQDGNLECRCVVYVRFNDSQPADSVRNGRNEVDQHFARARWAAQKAPHILSRVKERDAVDNDLRWSIVYDGSLTPIDGVIANRYNTGTYYSLRWIRAPFWELSGTEASTWKSQDSLSSTNSLSGMSGRIKSLRVHTQNAEAISFGVSEIWAGIKEDLDIWTMGYTDNLFDSHIDLNYCGFQRGPGARRDDSSGLGTPTGTRSIFINFTDEEDVIKFRFFSPMKKWNSTIEASVNTQQNMTGRYRVLMRYILTTDPGDAEIAVRPVTMWQDMIQKDSKTEEYFFSTAEFIDAPPTYWIKPAAYRERYETVDLGEINIGVGSLGSDATQAFDIGSRFCFGIEAGLFGDAENQGKAVELKIDRFDLIPAERFVHVVLPDTSVTDAGDKVADWSTRSMHVITEPDGTVALHVTGRTPSTESVLGTVITNVDQNNWGILPHAGQHKLIVATNGSSSNHANQLVNIKAVIAPRSRRFPT